MEALLTEVVDIGDAGYIELVLTGAPADENLRHPTNILYVRYSSLS